MIDEENVNWNDISDEDKIDLLSKSLTFYKREGARKDNQLSELRSDLALLKHSKDSEYEQQRARLLRAENELASIAIVFTNEGVAISGKGLSQSVKRLMYAYNAAITQLRELQPIPIKEKEKQTIENFFGLREDK